MSQGLGVGSTHSVWSPDVLQAGALPPAHSGHVMKANTTTKKRMQAHVDSIWRSNVQLKNSALNTPPTVGFGGGSTTRNLGGCNG